MQDYIPRKIDINEQLPTVVVKQFDNLSRFIHVQIFDNDLPDISDDEKYFNLENCTARLYVQPKGDDSGTNVAFIDGEVADDEHGIVTFLLPSSVTETAGNYEAEIWIYGAESSHPIISTKPFGFVVEKSIRNTSAIEGTSKFTALDNVLSSNDLMRAQIAEMDAESQAVSNEVSTLKTLVASITQQVTGITQQIENINASQSSDTVADGISAGTVAAMLQCAETYFNYAYTPDGKDSGILYESHTGLYSTSLGSNAANKQYGIVCSSFVCAILNAISFGNSRYNGRSTNLKYNWGVEFDDTGVFGTSDSDQNSINYKYLSSYNLAKYAAEHNYFYTINANATVRPGDVVFHVDDSLTDGRYLKIDHVAIIINTDGTNCTIVESWPSTKTDIDKTTHDVGLQIRQRELSYFAYGATFPLGNVWNEPKVIESVHNLSGSTTAASDLLTQTVEQGFYTIVCHGTYSDNLYVRKVYTNGSEAVNVDGGLYNIGNVHYLTVYAEKPATIIARMPKESTYDISDITLYKGYADIATAY